MGIFAIIDTIKTTDQALNKGSISPAPRENNVPDTEIANPRLDIPPIPEDLNIPAMAETVPSSLDSAPYQTPSRPPATASGSAGLAQPGRANKLDEKNAEYFRAAWPWLQANLPGLLSAGWHRRALFQRGKNRYPAGQWGVAWLPVWRKKGLSLTLNRHTGAIAFHFSGTDGRPITQTAHPRKPQPDQQKN